MKTKNILKVLFMLFLTFTVVNCGYNEDEIKELEANRVFAPVALSAVIRNQTAVELNWTKRDNVAKYIVEFSANDPDFSSIYKTVEVLAEELPIQVVLEGETEYSIRVKAISSIGLEDSSWAVITATTLTEQLVLLPEPGDIAATEATLRWVANSDVTQITVQPGDIIHEITSQEKIDGFATITGLIGETSYTFKLLKGTKIRGYADIVTGIDVGDNTLVLPTDDLFQMIADAESGDILLLEQGDYTAQTGLIELDKSITIQGLRTDFKPKLKVAFSIVSGAVDVRLIDLDLEGSGPTLDQTNDVVKYLEAGSYGNLLISGCNIHNYRKSLVYGDVESSGVNSVTIENTIVTDAWCNGSDFIDFRKTNLGSLTIKTSTFNNVASSTITGARDFIRIDETGTTGTGLTTTVLVENNTLHNVSNNAGKRILYIRYNINSITVRNNLIAETLAIYSNQSKTSVPTFLNNNYFNATGLHNTATIFDSSASLGTLDPGFVDAASGNFKITNQTLLDNQVGDPRWRL